MTSEYKGFMIEGDGAFGLKKIRRNGSGALPNALLGLFTNSEFARRAINQHMMEKEKPDGEKVSTSRG